MGSMVQSYGAGGSSKAVTTAPPMGGGDSELMDLFRETARRRMAPAPQQQVRPVGPAAPPGPASPPQRQYNDTAQNQTPLQREAERAQMAQYRAISGQAPMRMVSGAGIVPGYMPDVNATSGAQRQVFLPKESQNNAGIDIDAEARRRMLESASFGDFQKFSQEPGRAGSFGY